MSVKTGTIGWIDLTTPDAPRVRDFYSAVAGWEVRAVPMGGYSDYAMGPPGGEPVSGVCHARGVNTGLPACWLIYITVADLDAAVASAVRLGGSILQGPREMGSMGRCCVIKDPAGAAAALFEKARGS